tara:strand:- start:75 stop:1679 length:1605 start_codon:yes stop_codon:yes gene_type:complete
MALQSSGQISLNDIHVEAGGSTGTEASINDSDIRSLVDASSGKSNLSFNQFYGASAEPPGDIKVGDKFVFTSCKMMGAMGPYHEMVPAYYSSQGYNSTFTNQFQLMQYAGIQRWKFPEAGTYKFTLCGAWAGHMVDQGYDNRDGSNYMDTSSVTYSNGYPSVQPAQETYSNGYVYGNPGKLTVYRTCAAGDIMDIMIGQRSLPMQFGNTNTPTSHVCAPGGGATVIAFNQGSTSGWDYGMSNYNAGDVAIAGGAGANRNNVNYAYSDRDSKFGTTGSDGDWYGADGGTDGYGGGDSQFSYYDFTSGAGWRGDGSEHTDERTTGSYMNIQVLDGRAQALFDSTYPGQGGLSAAVWAKPYYYNSYQRVAYYIGIGNDHLVNEFGHKQTSTADQYNMSESKIKTWANLASSNKNTLSKLIQNGLAIYNTRIGTFPISTYMGGFGGGSVGNYGGAGSGGGWSGGGAGRYYWSGGGSTYFVQNSGFGTAYTFSTPYSNSNDAHWNFKYANCPHFGISSDTSIKTGLLRGNGWLQVERTA